METKNITIRGVSVNVWRNFRAAMIKENVNIGEAVTGALEIYLKKQEGEKPKYNFMDLKPVDFGPGNENLSERIDEVLYDRK